ncbi:MAG TPA: hypothetical protein VF520_05010 [Thermoleophilaceae bacterium]|jgi:hypothetical protein
MKRRTTTLAVATLALALAGAAPAAAKPHPKKVKTKHQAIECPTGYTGADENWASTLDANANGVVCVNRLTGAVADDTPDGAVLTAPTGTTSCPPLFEFTGFAVMPAADLNGDGFICLDATTVTVVDNVPLI